MQPEDSTVSLDASLSEAEPVEGTGSGLARSIRSLFDSPEDAPGEGEPDAAAIAREDRDRFTASVERYLGADSAERDALVPEIIQDARALKRSDAVRAVADGAVSLALTGGDTGDEQALALAGELLDTGVAIHLAVRLGTERDPEAREPLSRVATLLPEALAPALADALAEASDRGARRSLMDALLALGDPGRDAVFGLLEDRRWYAVRNGVTLLGEMGDPETVQALTVPLAHDDARVRRETLTSLAKIGGEDAGLLIVGMLDDPDPDVRAGAAMGAGILEVERAHRPLLEHLVAEDVEEVQVQILRALGQLGDPGAVPLIEKRATGSLFSRPPRAIRIAAYRALAAIGTPHARSVLEAAASDRDAEIRSAIEGILRNRPRTDAEEVEEVEDAVLETSEAATEAGGEEGPDSETGPGTDPEADGPERPAAGESAAGGAS